MQEFNSKMPIVCQPYSLVSQGQHKHADRDCYCSAVMAFPTGVPCVLCFLHYSLSWTMHFLANFPTSYSFQFLLDSSSKGPTRTFQLGFQLYHSGGKVPRTLKGTSIVIQGNRELQRSYIGGLEESTILEINGKPANQVGFSLMILSLSSISMRPMVVFSFL